MPDHTPTEADILRTLKRVDAAVPGLRAGYTVAAIPSPAPVVIVRSKGGRHHIGRVALSVLNVDRPHITLDTVRRLNLWPTSLGLDGLAAIDALDDTSDVRVGPVLPRMWIRDVDAIWWTQPDTGDVLLALPASAAHDDPARPLIPTTDEEAAA